MRVLVVFGGTSAEHDVSMSSGLAVVRGALEAGHRVVAAHIDRSGSWRAEEVRAPAGPSPLPLGWPSANPWDLLTSADGRPDVVMAVLHGPVGEDGAIVALARLADVAVVGAGLASSAVCLDKTFTADVLDARGIAQARWLEIQPGTSPPSYAEAVDRLGATALFVKPANLGSSIGISRVGDDAQWADALAEASGYDDTLIVEAAVDGRELSVSIIGNRAEGYEVSEPSETRPHGSFLDFDDKYGSDAAMAIVPAELDPTTRRRVRELGPRVARALRVDGLVRVDLFLTPTGDLLVNEVNTMPGFTAESTFPRMWAASGLDFPRLVDRLLELARRRHADTGARTGARTGAHTGARAGSAAGGITVRDATEADWARIGELTVAAYAAVPGRPSLPDYDRRLADTASRAQRLSLLVAEDAGGRVVGTVGYSLVEGTDGRVGRARQVAVDPGCKGLGIGRALMERAMLRLGEVGADEMIERTAEYMTDAQAMYRALGFSRAPEWDEDQPDGPRLLAFRRRL